MKKERVVITGLGAVTPIGIGIDAFWNAAKNGTNGLKPITAFDASMFRTDIGGEVKNFQPQEYLSSAEISSMGRSSHFAIAASEMAIKQSGIDISKENPFRFGVSLGTTMGEPQILEQCIEKIFAANKRTETIDSNLPGQYPCGVIAAHVARHFKACGPTIMIPTACAAGNYAIGYAFDLLGLGCADIVIAGGSDPISKIAYTGFSRLLATAKESCKPFDKNRDGMAVGEGAGMLVMETLTHAQKRGATILAEVLGYGIACDAHNMTIPDPSGSGGILALSKAFANANISPDTIDYISAHGTGTKENDKTETFIIKSVFQEKAKSIPISSIKSMIGHTMGAASAIEAVACCLMIQHNTLLPTINYSEPDPECDLDYVPNVSRNASVNRIVSNAYAFGGNTSALIVGRFGA